MDDGFAKWGLQPKGTRGRGTAMRISDQRGGARTSLIKQLSLDNEDFDISEPSPDMLYVKEQIRLE